MQNAQFDVHEDMEDLHWWFVGRRRILMDVIHEVLPPSRSSLVVDVGCGTGANLAALAREYSCIGVDTHADAIDRARRRCPGVEIVHGSAPEVLGERARQADLFLLADVIEHVQDDRGLLSRLAAASKPGALILLTVPAGPELWTQHDVSFGHYRRYTHPQLAQVWTGLALKTLMLSHYNSHLYPAVRALRILSRRRGRAGGAAGTDFAMPRIPGLNRLLTATFASEAHRLRAVLGGRSSPYRRGVSLIGLLRHEPPSGVVETLIA